MRAWRLAACALLAGLVYYVCLRTHVPPRGLAWIIDGIPDHASVSDPTWGTFPSLAYGVMCGAMAFAMARTRNQALWATAAAVIVALVLEANVGTADPIDVLALLLGAIVAMIHLSEPTHVASRLATALVTPEGSVDPPFTLPRATACLFMAVASTMLVLGSDAGELPGCARYDDAGYCAEYRRFATPVYLSYATLRAAVRVEPARPMDHIGQLHVIGTVLFVGERNRGVHVIDNADPANPRNIGFIRIPGNTEVAVRGSYLYADSYIDLVTLDVSDPGSVSVVNRQMDVFPWDAFQNIPYDIGFRSEDIDAGRGVVVSYAE